MLNPEQQAAVLEDGHTLVIALPGSGKTKLSVDKIDRLLSLHPTARVGAVTFTRDAANELQKRISKKVGAERAKRVDVDTFHRHSISQLRAANCMPNLLSPAQQFNMALRARDAAGFPDIRPDQVSRIIENVKSSIDLTAETLADEQIYREYSKLLDRHNLCDMQDLVRLSLDGMRQGTVEPLNVQFLLVDEFQDTDRVQLEWVLEHTKRGIIATVVGDDDQSIYGWRHALGVDGMSHFRSQVKARLITLSTNYRCHEEILQRAGNIIVNNPTRISKTLHSHKGRGGKVEVIKTMSREREAEEIAKRILASDGKWVTQGNGPDEWQEWQVPPESFAVLTRSNILLRLIAAELGANSIAFTLGTSAKDIWAMPPLCHLVGLLESLAKGTTLGVDNALAWRGISEEGLQQVHHAGAGSLNRLLASPGQIHGLEKKEQDSVIQFLSLLQGWKAQLEHGRITLVIGGIKKWLEATTSKKDLNDLCYGAELLGKRLEGPLASRLRVITRKREKTDGTPDSAVQLLTMHGSKGLEFNSVWIAAVDDGTIPSSSRQGDSPIDEERRLMYVAMTRARQGLTISYATTPSFFLKEAGLIVRDR